MRFTRQYCTSSTGPIPSGQQASHPISTEYSDGIMTPGVDVIVDDGRKAVRFKLPTTTSGIKAVKEGVCQNSRMRNARRSASHFNLTRIRLLELPTVYWWNRKKKRKIRPGKRKERTTDPRNGKVGAGHAPFLHVSACGRSWPTCQLAAAFTGRANFLTHDFLRA